MRNNKNHFLPGIKKVEYCFASELTLQDMVFLQEGDTVEPVAQFVDMHIIGLGKCEINEKLETGEMIYETKLSFFTSERPAQTNKFLCYRITTVQGEQYLIGTNKRPFTIRECRRTITDQVTQKQGYSVTVTYKNIHSILLIEN